MNEKAFTLVELIAVVVIMAIIMVIATPNIVNMLDKGKKEDYVADAKNFISKATYEYRKKGDTCNSENGSNDEGAQEGENNNEVCSMKLSELGISEEDQKDPYGLNYDLEGSEVVFSTLQGDGSNTLPTRQVSITLISHDTNTCYMINGIQKTDLNKDNVKKGTYSAGSCSIP